MEQRRFNIRSQKVKATVIDLITRLPIDPVFEVVVRLADRRSLDQNAKLWPMLDDVARQVCWHGHYLTKEEWKDVFTASLRQELKVVPNIQGTGFVILGLRTSKMSKREFTDLIEFIHCFGAERGVKWKEQATKLFEEYRRAA